MFPCKSTCTKSIQPKSQLQSNSKLLVLSPRPQPQNQPSPVTMAINPSRSLPTISLPNLLVPTYSPTAHPVSQSFYYPSNNSVSQPTISAHVQPPLTIPQNSHTMIIRSKAGIFKPKAYLSSTCLTPALLLTSIQPWLIHVGKMQYMLS